MDVNSFVFIVAADVRGENGEVGDVDCACWFATNVGGVGGEVSTDGDVVYEPGGDHLF